MSSNLKVRCKRTLSSRLSQKVFQLNGECKSNSGDQIIQNNVDTKVNSNDVNSVVNISRNSFRLNRQFFHQPCITLAKSLLGKILARKLESGEVLKGIIVETESYLGVEDQASHSYQGKKTERNQAMFMQSGTAYVYSIYGMYYCFNISSFEDGSAVLIRAIEPLHDTSTMLSLRSLRRKGSKVLKVKDLCNGPSKLCQAFKIDKQSLNKIDLCTSEDLWIEEGSEIHGSDIVACRRIGIDSAGLEWANKPLRFYVKNCPFVSVRNKLAETHTNLS